MARRNSGLYPVRQDDDQEKDHRNAQIPHACSHRAIPLFLLTFVQAFTHLSFIEASSSEEMSLCHPCDATILSVVVRCIKPPFLISLQMSVHTQDRSLMSVNTVLSSWIRK